MVVISELKCRWIVDDLFQLTKMISHLCCKYISVVESLPYLESDAIRYTDAIGCSYLTGTYTIVIIDSLDVPMNHIFSDNDESKHNHRLQSSIHILLVLQMKKLLKHF